MKPSRDADSCGLADPLQACRHVHAITKDVVTYADVVALVNANAKFDPPRLRHLGVAVRHGTLELYRAPQRVDHARKLHEQAIARRLNNAASIFDDLGVHQGKACAWS